MQFGESLKFHRITSLLPSGSKSKLRKNPGEVGFELNEQRMESVLLFVSVSARHSLALLSISEDRSDIFLRNFGLSLSLSLFLN
jgi:hypothetical protein